MENDYTVNLSGDLLLTLMRDQREIGTDLAELRQRAQLAESIAMYLSSKA